MELKFLRPPCCLRGGDGYQSNLYGIEIGEEREPCRHITEYQSNLYGIEILDSQERWRDMGHVSIEPLWN